jgi:uncharacterized membrane protein HdeD (DUF308 family)
MPSPFMLTGLDQVRSKWGWFVALGIALIVVGAIAIGANYLTTLVTMIFLGWLLIFTGVFEAVSAFNVRGWGGFFLHLLGAAIDLVLGYLFLIEPAQGAAVLTLFLACLFFVGGGFRIAASLSTQFPGWEWSIVSGIINVVLGVLLIKQWPYDGLWFIGFCVGLELIFRGWFWVMLGMALKQTPKAA